MFKRKVMQNDYIAFWSGTEQLEVTYSDHQVQLPGHMRAKRKLKHVAEGIIPMPLKH